MKPGGPHASSDRPADFRSDSELDLELPYVRQNFKQLEVAIDQKGSKSLTACRCTAASRSSRRRRRSPCLNPMTTRSSVQTCAIAHNYCIKRGTQQLPRDAVSFRKP